MRTDELISLLAADASPVDRTAPERVLRLTAIGSVAVCAVAIIGSIGLRPNFVEAFGDVRVVVKYGFTLLCVVAAGFAARALLRPGRPAGWVPLALAAPFGAVLLAAATEAMLADPATLMGRVWGAGPYQCLTCVAGLGLLSFAALVVAFRAGAPTRPALAGGVVGLLAGSLAAASYALHCTEDSVLYVAAWYGLGILAVGAVGWALGPRLLRW